MLRLSNGRGNSPLVLPWSWDLPQTVVIRWTGSEYEALATYAIGAPLMPEEKEEPDVQARRAEQSAGIDLGEIHAAVAHDGHHTHIMNGRLLRSKRQYQNKLKAELDSRIARKKQGSKRRKKLIRTKQKQLRKMKNQIKDVEHKLTSKLICTLQREGVQRLVIGDVRSIRKDLDVGSTNNQKLHQWSFGSVRHKLTYKGERAGMRVTLQEERDTSRTCPVCGHRRKSKPRGRVFSCTNKTCKWSGHRDAVGAMNIRYKYRGEFGSPHVVGDMAPPTGCGYIPQLVCSSGATVV
jgi:putative transposase